MPHSVLLHIHVIVLIVYSIILWHCPRPRRGLVLALALDFEHVVLEQSKSFVRNCDFAIAYLYFQFLPRDARSPSAVLLSYVVRPSVCLSVRL